MTQLKNCPSCGRPIKFEEKYARIIACAYCNSILEFGKGELNKIGEQGEFIEFPSIFIVGKTIIWENKKVYVKGQLRYEYDGGFFDEFFVLIDNKEYYIREDDGNIKIIIKGEWQKKSINLLNISVGENIELDGIALFIQESGIFKLISIKGFINTKLVVGKNYEYLDGIYNGKILYVEKEVGTDKIRINKELKL